jgi:hypothetical protein
MKRMALLGWMLAVTHSQMLLAQSVVFVSPSTKGPLTMSCTEASLNSFEQTHYLATTHYVAEHLCQQPRIEGGVGIWKGQAQNSGIVDGCANEKARDIGALLGKYYHQTEVLVFDRNSAGKSTLVSFRASQPLGVIAIEMAQANVSGATVVPHPDDNLVMIVATGADQRSRALNLYALLKAHGLKEEEGNAELVGDEDRGKAREVYDEILSHAPAEVRQLGEEMYTEQFSNLGLEETVAH